MIVFPEVLASQLPPAEQEVIHGAIRQTTLQNVCSK